jgi:hypothetical protein
MTTTTALRTITGQNLGVQLHSKVAGVELRQSAMKPVRNDSWHKPQGGLWTSTKDENIVSGWYEWAHSEGMLPTEATTWELTPERDAVLIEVDSLGDLTALLERYSEGERWGRMPRIDFEAMVQDGFDGMHLTDSGQWATRMSDPSLYGWDCESTVWFRWAFEGLTVIT